MVIFKNKNMKNMKEFDEKQLHQRHLNDLSNFKNLGVDKSSPSTSTGLKSKGPLHNFSLDDGLKWGKQRYLRCIKVQEKEISNLLGQEREKKSSKGCDLGDLRSGIFGCGFESDDNDSYYLNCEIGLKRKRGLEFGFDSLSEKRSKEADVDDIEISDVKEKGVVGVENGGDEMKEGAIFGKGGFEDGTREVGLREEERVQPWNLRTRRATNRPVKGGDGDGVRVGVGVGGVKSLKLDVIKPKIDALVGGETTLRRRGGGVSSPGGGSPNGEKKEREKFSVALGQREIEEDFLALVGHKPPRRPKKRAKYVQKKLDTLFPGLWLSEITADLYKVSET